MAHYFARAGGVESVLNTKYAQHVLQTKSRSEATSGDQFNLSWTRFQWGCHHKCPHSRSAAASRLKLSNSTFRGFLVEKHHKTLEE
eukprot:5136259-Amphidinium_carterae.1